MKTNPPNSDSDCFRIVDLFSPSEEVDQTVDEASSAGFHPRPVSTEMPASFLYMNPFFSSSEKPADAGRV